MRFRMSGLKILGMFAALTLVAGCGSTADQAGSSSSYGSSSSTTGADTGTVSTTAAGSQEDLAVNVGDRVHFDYDSFELTAEARGVLERQAAWLKSNASINVVVEGHCDERGTREYNLALGDRRTSAAKNYLVALGVADDRVSTISYGKERPIAFGSNAADWAKNRRGVTVVR
jgi:peptidoglycan-associated lipoprotein